MKRINAITAGVTVGLYLVGWWTSGAPIMRGGAGLFFYTFLLAAVAIGWCCPFALDEATHKEIPGPGDVRSTLNQLQEQAAVLTNRILEVEKRVTDLSVVTGLRPHPAPKPPARG